MNDRAKTLTHHPIQINNGSLVFTGYDTIHAPDCICFVARGNHFHSYGIADHSLLLASTSATIADGDLVIRFEHNHPHVYLYTNSTTDNNDQIPAVHTKQGLYAKVIGSFNLYD